MRRNIGSPLAGRVSSNFGGSVNHRTKKIIAGLLIATIGPLIATTLAASVSINSGANLEFGQGSQAAVACDSAITSAITESWSSGSTTTFFRVATISLTGLDTTACAGKNLKISLLGVTGTALTVTGAATSITVALTDASGSLSVGSLAAGPTAANTTTGTNNTLTVTINAATNLDASTVYRVALETS
jgi:hypothetical protein